MVALQNNYDYYLDEDRNINWESTEFANRERATQAMKDYAAAKKTESELVAESLILMGRTNAVKSQVRNAKLMQRAYLESVEAADTRMNKARTELYKAQEELNAAKGGWLIDRVPGSGGDWWVTTKNGYAFPRVYNALFDIRVTYIGDEGEGASNLWGLDCAGKANNLDRRIEQLIGRNPNAPFNVFKEFIQAYEPPWSPFASPAAFTSEGRRTAQTPEAKAQLAQARQAAQRDDTQSRAIRATLGQRLGAAAGHNRPITLNELRAYGVGGPLSALPGQTQGVPAMAPNTQGIGLPASAPPIQPPTMPLFQAAQPAAQPLFQAAQPQTSFPAAAGPMDHFVQSSVPPPEEPTFFNRPDIPQSSTPQPESVASRIGSRPGRGVRTSQPKLGVWGGRRNTRRRKGYNRSAHRRRHSRRKPSTR